MSTTVAPLVLVARDGGVLTLTLNRPEKLNALTVELIDDLRAVIVDAGSDTNVRAVLITGAGRGFSAGADLTVSFNNPNRDVRQLLHDHYAPLITAMRTLEKPIIAAVNGVAAGAGMSLALCCDLRIAAQSAYFLQAFVRIGLVPDAGSTYFLPRLIGEARALELGTLGERVPAADALRIGLVNRVVPDAELAAAAMELADRLARGPRSLGLIKRAIYQSLDNDLDIQLRLEEELQALAAASADAREGVVAFIEKRPAEFTGR